jgi:hypothetical protein
LLLKVEEEKRRKSMFTVKILSEKYIPKSENSGVYRQVTKLIEATSVTITNICPNVLSELSGVCSNGESFRFFIGDLSGLELKESIDYTEISGYRAYIENEKGATTEIIKFE